VAPEAIAPAEAAPEANVDAQPETTLLLWQVRRGPEPVGRVQAGSEEWALRDARREFGDDVVVEPLALVPSGPPKAKAERKPKDPTKLSAIDAAAKFLADAGKSLTCKELITAMAEKQLWTSPGGKTPDATRYSAILREIGTKGDAARFVNTEPGKFAAKA
jgi:HB1, ASXL, restriction endonuclease HTH domain